ncbi:MAG TPA: ROK family protein [Propionicimonas sp.]|uniref:ROK family protein n=1 Tax=Propionicimonas sp. TaxID=1955623 RepID=UPI002F402614
MTIDPAEARGLHELVQILRDGQHRTRSELMDLTGRGRSTIAGRLGRLIDRRLVTAIGEAGSTGGRPPSTFALDTTGLIVIAIDIGATHARVALTNLAAGILVDQHVAISAAHSPDDVLEQVMTIAHRLLESIRRPMTDVIGIGVGVPVSVRQHSARPRTPSSLPGWDGMDVAGTLAPMASGVPVLVDNDANLMALGEHAFSYPDADNLLFVKVATGIGAGIICDGRLMHGDEGAAGDIAHITIPSASGKACRCGNTGCVEAVAGGLALQSDISDQVLPVTSNAEIIALVRAGNVYAMSRLRAAGRDIGEVLAACVSVLNPSTIVVGGKLAEAGEHLLAGIRESVYGHSLPQATRNLRIVTSRAMGQAGVLGASRLVIDNAFSHEGLIGLL